MTAPDYKAMLRGAGFDPSTLTTAEETRLNSLIYAAFQKGHAVGFQNGMNRVI
jgi:hypothetical protein